MAAAPSVTIKMRIPWRAGVVVPAAAAALTAALCQLHPSVATFGHGFTTLFCTVTGLAFYAVTGRVLRGMYASQADEAMEFVLQRALYLLLLGALGAAAAGLAVMYAFNEFRHGCYFGRGMPYFWATWPPVVLFAIVMGLWTAARGWGFIRRFLLLLIFAVALGLYLGIQAELGLRPVDPLFGLLLAADQRADMTVPQIHLYHRVGVLLLTASLWWTCLWRQGGAWGLRRRWVALSWLLTALYIGGFGSHVGFGFGYGKIHGTLSETRESEHFVFHYAPHGDAAANMDATVRYGERVWTRLSELMEVAPTEKTTVYVTDNRQVLWELSGLRAANALPWRLMAPDDDVRRSTFAHELVHAFDLGDARGNTAGEDRWAARQRLLQQLPAMLLYRGPTEGIAHAFSNGYVQTPLAHQRQAAALAEDKLPSATVFMGRGGFAAVHESNAYNLAGSFMGFLVRVYGMTAMHTFLEQRSDYERAFGKDLAALDAEWREFLREVPLSTSDVARFGRSFDTSIHTSFREQCCPKLGSREPVLEDEAQRAFREGRYGAALDAYDALYAESGDPRERMQQVKVHWAMGNMDLALGVLEELLSAPDLTDAQRLDYHRWRVRCLAALGRWDELETLLARWPEIEPDAGPEVLRRHRLLRDERFRERYAVALTSRDSYERRYAMESLAEAFPDNVDVRYALLEQQYAEMWPRSGTAGILPENRKKLDELMAMADNFPELVDLLGPVLQRFVTKAIESEDFDLADALVDVIAQHTTDPLRAYQMPRFRERIAFERNYAATQ